MWVTPDTESIDPGYEQLDINGELAKGGLVPIASGKGHDAAISIRQAGAVLYGGRLQPGETVTVPDDRHVHVFVPRIGIARRRRRDRAGDGRRGSAHRTSETLDLTAGDDGAEVLDLGDA